ncbi:MAG: hypothetical protein OCD00_04340 [Colwellia sp.]
MDSKYNINLLQPELLPEMPLLSFKRVVVIWLVVFIVMSVWILAEKQNHQVLTKQYKSLQQTNHKQSALVKTLEEQISNRKVNSALKEKLDTLKLLMTNKQALHTKLTDTNQTFVTGFASAMSELADFHHKDIRLQAVKINNNDMTFSGLTKVPEAVPAWLAGFEHSVLLSGKSFVHFKLSQNEQNITEFVVSSAVNRGEIK